MRAIKRPIILLKKLMSFPYNECDKKLLDAIQLTATVKKSIEIK